MTALWWEPHDYFSGSFPKTQIGLPGNSGTSVIYTTTPYRWEQLRKTEIDILC